MKCRFFCYVVDVGADKVSIGSDAAYAAESYIASGRITTGSTSIETIVAAYGQQAVVISVDPKRVFFNNNIIYFKQHSTATIQQYKDYST